MSNMIQRIQNFIKSEDGPTAVEYAIMVALIAVVIIAAVTTLQEGITGTFTDAAGELGAGG